MIVWQKSDWAICSTVFWCLFIYDQTHQVKYSAHFQSGYIYIFFFFNDRNVSTFSPVGLKGHVHLSFEVVVGVSRCSMSMITMSAASSFFPEHFNCFITSARALFWRIYFDVKERVYSWRSTHMDEECLSTEGWVLQPVWHVRSLFVSVIQKPECSPAGLLFVTELPCSHCIGRESILSRQFNTIFLNLSIQTAFKLQAPNLKSITANHVAITHWNVIQRKFQAFH